MAAIVVHNLWKVYRYYPSRVHRLKEWVWLGHRDYATKLEALRDLSFKVEPGESVGVIGRNGAGKSTLLRVLAGISPVTSGTCEVSGAVSAMIELGAQFHPDYTGRDNLLISGIMLGLSRREAEARLAGAVEFAELGAQIDQPLRTYSTGMQARLAFAASTLVSSDVLLVDEVLAVGDQFFVKKCIRHIQEYLRTGRTLLFVSHDLTLIRALCQRVLWVDQGRLVADGAVGEICRDYRRSIQEEENARGLVKNRKVQPSRARPQGDSRAVTADEQIQITGVRLLDGQGMERACFVSGQTLTVRIGYRSRIRYRNPNLSVTIERMDGTIMTAHSSKDQELETGDIEPGEGCFELVFSPLVFGPGTYAVHVAMTTDELLAYGDTNFDRLEGAQEFTVVAADNRYAVAIAHPVVWKREGRPLRVRAADPRSAPFR